MSELNSWLGKSALHSQMDQTLISSDSLRSFCSLVFNNPLSWWILILLVLYLMEVLQIGPHSFPWNWKKEKAGKGSSKVCMNGVKGPLYERDECDGDQQGEAPEAFHRFIRTRVVPTFRKQCVNGNNRFAVLLFSHVNNLRHVKNTRFRQITFNGKPLVDASLATYPEAYRYENYGVARSNDSEHPEALIAKQVPALLAGFGKAERCYLRNPIPTFGILYTSAAPCSQCTADIIRSLATVCRKRMVVVYDSHNDDSKESETEKNFQRMMEAGISVIRIRKQ